MRDPMVLLLLVFFVAAVTAPAFADETRAPAAPADTSGPGDEPGPPTRPREARSPAGIEVLRAYVCEGIEAGEPAQAGMSFIPAGTGSSTLCCFTEIGLPAGRDTVVHVWRWGDREMSRIPLEVRGPRWRTWSEKRIQGDWRGAWSVDVADRSGFVMMRLDFSVE